jgi:hypothetical protein
VQIKLGPSVFRSLISFGSVCGFHWKSVHFKNLFLLLQIPALPKNLFQNSWYLWCYCRWNYFNFIFQLYISTQLNFINHIFVNLVNNFILLAPVVFVDSLRFFYVIMPSANKDKFLCLSDLYAFILLFNRSDETRPSSIVPNLRGKSFTFYL